MSFGFLFGAAQKIHERDSVGIHEYIGEDSVIAYGHYINNLKFGQWNYYFLNRKLFKTNIYSIDTILYPNLADKVRLELFEKYNLDSVTISYTEFREDISPTVHAIGSYDLPVIENFKNGTLHKIIQKEGTSYFYLTFDSTGIREEKETIVEGKLTGKFWYYFKSGQLMSEGNQIDGGMEGEVLWYKEDGTIRLKRMYKRGMPIK
jgi:hypothetical protein